MISEPLSFEDAFEILRPALPDDSLVLVGGQAVSYWLTYYRNRDASLAGLVGVTSDDVDFLGTVQSAAQFAAAIGGTVRYSSVADLSPTDAIVTFMDKAGIPRDIDFLWSVHGLDEKRVRDTSIPVELTDLQGHPTGIELRVLHPVLCLWSRVENTAAFEKYQTPRALKQLQASIGCARAYVVEKCDDHDIRAAHRAISVIAEIVCGEAGHRVYERFGLDALDSIPCDPRLGQAFLEERLPRLRRAAGR